MSTLTGTLQAAQENETTAADGSRISLESVFQVIPDMFFLLDADGTILDYRASRREALYVPPEHFLNKKLADVFPSETASEVLKNIEITLANGALTRFEYYLNYGAEQRRFECRMTQVQQASQCIAIVRDITSEHLATTSLTSKQGQMRTLIRAIPDLIWAMDLSGRFIFTNPTFELMCGVSESEILGKTIADFFDHREARDRVEKFLKVIQTSKPSIHEESFHFKGNGYRGLFSTIRTPILNGSGEITGMLGTSRDITAERRNQAILQERIKEQQCLYKVFKITENNKTPLKTMFQQVIQEMQNGWQFVEDTGVRLRWSDISVCTSGFAETRWMQTATVSTSNHEPVEISVAYVREHQIADEGPFLKEERTLLNTVAHRIEEVINRRRIEEKLLEREQIFAAMFSQVTDSILLVDPATGAFIDFNTNAHIGLGYTREEFAKLMVKDIQAEHDSAMIVANTQQALLHPVSFETRHRGKDGSIMAVKLKMATVQANGRPAISAVWQDITEQKAREAELRAAANRLSQNSKTFAAADEDK